MQKYNPVSAWWNHCAVSNYVARFYNFAIEGVRKVQRKFEAEFASKLPALESKWIDKLRKNGIFTRAEVDDQLTRHRGLADAVMNPFQQLQERIRDGDINSTASLIGEISKMVADQSSDVQQRADDAISRSNSKAQEALDTANTKARDGIDRVNTVSQDRINNITSIIKEHTPTGSTIAGQHPADAAGGVAKTVVDGVHSAAHSTSETATGIAKTAVDSAHSVSKSTIDTINAHLQPSTTSAAGPTYTSARSEIASVIKEITDATVSFGQEVSNTYKDLLGVLITTYRDGYIMTDLDKPTMKIGHMFYPRWWLDAVGYFNVRPNTGGILFHSNAYTTSMVAQPAFSVLHVIGLVALGAVGFIAGRMSKNRGAGEDGVYRQHIIGLSPRNK
jgi:ElaB/YqjD/DUF883 family membrane-anchored ribosome-binding protein